MKDQSKISNTGRSQVLDMMRGFAMLMVIVCHTMQRAMGNICAQTWLWKAVYAWHMPLFFIVSGFLASKTSRLGTRLYIKGKLIRLMWPWFVWRWLEWLFMRFPFSGLLPFNQAVPMGFVEHILFLFQSPFRPLWFLIDLFLFLSLLSGIVYASRENDRKLNLLLFLSLLCDVVLFFLLISNSQWDCAYLYYDLQFYGLLIYGFLFGRLYQKAANKRMLCFWTLVISAIVYAMCKWIGVSSRFRIIEVWACGIMGTTLIGLVFTWMSRVACLSKINGALGYLGKYSLEFYTLQFLVLDVGYQIPNVQLRWAVNFFACMAICTGLILAIKKHVPLLDAVLWGNFRSLKKE